MVRCRMVSRLLRWLAIPVKRLAATREQTEAECEQPMLKHAAKRMFEQARLKANFCHQLRQKARLE